MAAGRSAGSSGVTADGAATYSLPLWVPPGRMGMQPTLSLEYNSRGGDGLLGKGWSLSGLSRITRCGRTLAQDGEADAIRFDATDRFCLDGVRLVAVSGTYGGHLTEYRTENNIFARIISLNPDGLGPMTFEAWLKDGRILTFGGEEGSRVEGKRARVTPVGSTGLETDFSQDVRYAWSVSQVRDRSGNFMQISYALSTGVLTDFSVEQWPTLITYTGSTAVGSPLPTRRVEFFYGERADSPVEHVSGLRLRRRVRLDRVEMWGPSVWGTTRVREYRFGYGTPSISGRTLLTSLQECDGVGVCKSPTIFNWTPGMTSFQRIDTGITDVTSGSGDYPEHMWNIHTLDLNGDGRDDLLYREYINLPLSPPQGIWWARLSTGNGFGPRQPAGIPPSFSLPPVWAGRAADMDQDGRVDLLKLHEENIVYDIYRSLGDGSFNWEDQWAEEAPTMWATAEAVPAFYLADLNGDGLPEGIRSVWTGTPGNAWGFRLNALGRLGPYKVWPMEAFIAGTEERAYAAPIDGSGRTAFLVRDRGADPNRYSALMLGAGDTPTKYVTTLTRTTSGQAPYWFLDVTGDGLADAVRPERTGGVSFFQGAEVSVFVNTGNGFMPARTVELPDHKHWLGPTEYSDSPNTDYGIRFADFNEDGRQDFWVANSISSRDTWLVLESQVDGSLRPRPLDVPLGDMAVIGFKLHQVMDANGDGLTDILQVEGGTVRLYLRSGTKPDLLSSVQDGLNGWSTFTYGPYHPTSTSASSLPTASVTRGLWVVVQHHVSNGKGGLNGFQHTYDDARVDLQGRGFLGFGSRVVEDLQTGAKTTTLHEQMTTRVGTAYPYAGRPTFEQTRITTEDGVEHRFERRTTYALTTEANGEVRSVWPESTEETRLEIPLGGTSADAIVTFGQRSSMTYDSFGNLTRHHQRSLYAGALTGDESLSEAGYNNDTAGWLIGRQAWFRSTSRTASGESVSRYAETGYDPVTGLVMHEIVEPTDSDFYLRTNYSRDALGRVTRIIEWDWGGNSRSTAISYDAVDGTFPAVVTNGLGHRTLLAWHSGLGVQVAEQDANGLNTRWKYDGLGRVRSMAPPDGANMSVSYGQNVGNPAYGLILTVQEATGAARVIEYDTLDRPVWIREKGFSGEWINHVTDYDAQGRIKRVFRPYSDLESLQVTEYEYDKLGRLLFERQPGGGVIEFKHSTRMLERWDALRNQQLFQRDELGRLRESTEVAPDGKRLQVRYTYGPFATLKKVEQLTNDVVLHHQDFQYDRYGQQTVFHEPYSGSRFHYERMYYNAWGELRAMSDASFRNTTLARDRLGRITRITNADGETLFTWDTAAGKGIGQIATTLSPDGVSSTYAYDALGRLEESTWNILGNSYSVQRRYDEFGRPLAILYPTVVNRRMHIQFGYTASGQLNRVYEPSTQYTIWSAEARTSTGHLKVERFGNGVFSSREYEPVRDVLKRIDTTFQSPNQVTTHQALAYEFDLSGNLKSRTDERATISESFNYDHLDRLKDWTVTAQGRRSVHSYRYDDLGNFLGRDVLEGDGTPISLTYDTTKGFGPYAVTHSTLGDYTYDTNGNQLTAPGRQVDYTAFDQPRRILKGTEAVLLGYTAGQQRAYKRMPNGDVTIYIEGIYEARKTATETYHVHHIPADGRIVAQEMWREAGGVHTNEHMLFLHNDHLGSVETITDQGGSLVSHHKYDPFGARADPTNPALPIAATPQQVRFGFTGHEQEDDLGLIHMRGRMYDPLTGRFLSRDPFVQFPLSGQSYNRYSYVMNNPLRWTDPSGFLMDTPEEDPVKDPKDSTYLGPNEILFCENQCTGGEGETSDGAMAESESQVDVTAPQADDNGAAPSSVQSGQDSGSGSAKSGEEEPGKKQGLSTIERVQIALDMGGMLPGVGLFFDIASAGVSAYRGNWGEAGLSLIGAIPGIGDAIKGAALAAKLGGVATAGIAAAKAIQKAKGGVRYRIGRALPPMEKTLDMALDPEVYAQAVVKRYGINLRGSGKAITLKFNPALVSAGKSRQSVPTIIEFGPSSLASEVELANTIAHELNHARSWLKGGNAPESTAYAAGDALGEFIQGLR
ncbi:MAG: VCBS repeat-containing protein [Myxococcaceae bacterium]|nr:VCBS repeat-containing protein [Myxococcaceae bacterium]